MYRVRVEFSGMQGSPWIATHYAATAAGTPAQAVAALGTFWGAIDGLMDNEVNWTTLTDVETVDAATGQVTAVTSVTPVTGTGAIAGEALPIATQGLIRWRTGEYIAGREVRGRTFIPGLTETANDNGQLSAASATTIQTAITTLLAAANFDLVVYSRAHAVEPLVDSGSVWSSFAVLRSRRD